MRNLYIALLTIGIISVLFIALDAKAGLAEISHDDDPETTEVVVKLDPVAGSNIGAINTAYGTSTIEVLVDSAGIYRLRVAAGSDAETTAELMEDDTRLIYAEPNYSSEAPEGNPRHIGAWGGPDDIVAEQYALDMLGIPDAHLFRKGAGVVVAVLDTGVQLSHPDLAESWTTARYDFVDDDADPGDLADGLDNDDDGYIDEAHGHGTHVAGIVHLTAPDAKIMPLRVLDADGRGNVFVISEAIQFAVKNGADVISLSLGSIQRSELMKDVLEDIAEQDHVVIVASAGNLAGEAEQYPAASDGVLAVTSIDKQSVKSDFANFGDWIDVAAPGEAILSAFPVSDHASWSGTSMAVPFVSGQAALIRSAVSTMSAIEITAFIRSSAQPLDPINPTFEGDLGSGRINVGGSMGALCTEEGVCTGPDLSDQIVLESRALVRSRPTNGLVGTWIIGSHQFLAGQDTRFREDEGALTVGTCVDIEYLSTLPYTALEIRSRERDKCPVTPSTPPQRIEVYLPAFIQ